MGKGRGVRRWTCKRLDSACAMQQTHGELPCYLTLTLSATHSHVFRSAQEMSDSPRGVHLAHEFMEVMLSHLFVFEYIFKA